MSRPGSPATRCRTTSAATDAGFCPCWAGADQPSAAFLPNSGRNAASPALTRAPAPLFPLDRAGRLARDVEHDPPDGADLIDHPGGDLLQQVVGQPRPVGGHRIVARHGPDHDHVAVGARVALDSDRADIGEHAERLPELAVEPGAPDLVLEDGVGLAQDLQPFT